MYFLKYVFWIILNPKKLQTAALLNEVYIHTHINKHTHTHIYTVYIYMIILQCNSILF